MAAAPLAAGAVGAATTTTTSTLAVAITVVATLVVVALLAAAVQVVRSARRVRHAAAELAEATAALIADVDSTVARAGAELERVGDLVGSAEQITDTVGAASRLAYASLANPLIKVLALGRGTARASRRLRLNRAQTERQRRLAASGAGRAGERSVGDGRVRGSRRPAARR
jgi:hypothetical protein